MNSPLPRWPISRLSWTSAARLAELPWSTIPARRLEYLADGDGPPEQATLLRLAWDETALYVHFECADRDAWGTWSERDDPLYEEEAVEVFLAPGVDDPSWYAEFEVSPRGVMFDALIHNPHGERATMRSEVQWDCPGLRWEAGTTGASQDWWAALVIPWDGLAPEIDRPPVWRANFYRIERPRDGETEFSCWSPTLTEPADFHKPSRFGFLDLLG
jgi:Carbohydrate-binding family 9